MATRNDTLSMARRFLLTMESVECTDQGFALQKRLSFLCACVAWRYSNASLPYSNLR